jgi:GntR family transcriptional regulator
MKVFESQIWPRTSQAGFLRSPNLVSASLYDALEELGHRPIRALQRMRSTVATVEQAKLLRLKSGAPLLEFE